MNEHNPIYLGLRDGYGGERPFFLSPADRRYHTYIIGQTGTGKSTLLKHILMQDILAGRGVGLIDPHGDLAGELLDCIPRSRTEDVVYFNPGDYDYPIAWNLLKVEDPVRKHLVVSGIVGAFKSIWRESWGPRLEYILSVAVATLIECENTSLLGVSRILSDRDYRHWALKQVKDPWIIQFWHNEFERQDPRFISEAIAPIQNKVGQILLAPPVRNIFGQVKSKVSARFMMDNRRIFIANLAKGAIGEDKANLIGALLVAQFGQAAMARVGVPEERREDFHLAIDEFQNFTTDSFASILSEARKYRLSLTLSHQYIAQLPTTMSAAVFGNVGTLVSFRVGEQDAGALKREFGYTYPAEHFTGLNNHEICVKIIQDGQHREPFTGRTTPPEVKHTGRREKIVQRSRERYSTPRAVVEDKMKWWLNESRGKEKTRRGDGLRRRNRSRANRV